MYCCHYYYYYWLQASGSRVLEMRRAVTPLLIPLSRLESTIRSSLVYRRHVRTVSRARLCEIGKLSLYKRLMHARLAPVNHGLLTR